MQHLIKNDDDPEIKDVFELTLQIKVRSSNFQQNKLKWFYKNLKHFDFNFQANENYLPGDTIGILPRNAEDVLNAILIYGPTLKSLFSQKVQIINNSSSTKRNVKIPVHLPSKYTTLSQIFSECVDLHAIPKKAFLWALHQRNCLTDATERRFIEILVSREGNILYTMEIIRKQTTFKSLLEILRSWHFSIDNISVLLEHLPRLMPRPYSISNSLLVTKAMKDFKYGWTILKIIFSVNRPPGITTGMLQQLIAKYESDKVLNIISRKPIINLYLRESNRFQFTENDLNRPLIMIAIGTGLAPFIAFCELLRHRTQTAEASKPLAWLLLGCKRRNKQLCADRIQNFIADGTLSKFTECYSRDPKHLGAKYVQDAIDENFINLMMEDNGIQNFTKVFVCGSRKMTMDIRSSIMKGLVQNAKCNSLDDAKRILDKLIESDQYNEDVWI